MPNPPNPFAAIAAGQKDGGASGRGRASKSRAAPYQSRSAKESKARARLRGSASARSGSSSSDTHGGQKKQQERPSDAPASTSPFAQLKSNGVTSQFGKPSLFPGAAHRSHAFGAPSLPHPAFGDSVDRNRDPRRRPAPQRPTPSKAAMSHVPVEDAKTINAYHERYEKLKLDRAKQRERAIRQGQMADPNQPTSLKKAITPVGTCTSMCPEYERVERIVQKMVDRSEKYLHPATNAYQNMESKMLKRFRRSAAGYDEQLPSDIRTPKTLLQTMNYLIRHVIGGPEPLGLIHKFVWDRTRSIRNDFSVQQLTQEDHVRMAVTCLERIARFHIVSLHLLSSPANQEQFDHHQEREQLNNTMLSLMYYYDDNRGRITFPNEEEFRAYYIVFAIHDQRPDLESRVQKWPKELLQSPKVRVALELMAAASNTWEYQGTLDEKRPNAIAQGFYTRFFSLVDSPSVSYLMACVAEIYFNNVRQTAIRSIWKAYCRYPISQQHKNEEWTLAELTKALYFDNEAQARQFCEEQGLDFAENSEGQLYLDWGSRPIDSVDFQPSSKHYFSERYVESKRGGRTLEAIILGLNIKQAARHGMIDRSLLATRAVPSQIASVSEASEDDELFVGEAESEISEERVNGHAGQIESDSAESVSSVQESDGLAAQPAAQTVESKPNFSSLFGGFGGKPSNPFAFQSQPSQPPQKHDIFSATAPKQETPSIFSQTPTPSSTPDVPSPKPATSSLFQPSQTSPFGATTTQPFSLAGGTAPDTLQAAEKPANAFDSVKTNNIFGTTPSFLFTPNQSQSANISFGGSLFSAPAQNGERKEDGQTPITFGQKNGISPPSTEGPAIFPTTKPASPVTTSPPSFVSSPIATPTTAATASPPLLSSSLQDVPSTVQDSNPPEQETPKAAPTTETVPSVVSSTDSDTSAPPDTEEFRKSWLDALRQSVSGRRHDSPPSRKRRLEEEEEPPSPEEEIPKAAEVSQPEKARPKRKSLALASIAPLPTLPILEEVKKMTTKRKPPPEEETKTRAQTQIDEDELLLSAARIAAESLKNGPKLFDAYPEPLPADRGRRTFTRGIG